MKDSNKYKNNFYTYLFLIVHFHVVFIYETKQIDLISIHQQRRNLQQYYILQTQR